MKPEEVSKSIKKSLVQDEKPEQAILPNPEFLSTIDMARNNKRNILDIMEKCLKSIPFIAENCFYAIFDGKNTILRPSVDLARLIYHNYSNLRIEMNVKDIQYKYIICEAVCFDLETNLAVKIPVYKSLLSPNTGKRYSEEQIPLLIAQANGIALRNAVFSVIPQSMIDTLLNRAISEAKKTQKADELIQWLMKEYNLTKDHILSTLNTISPALNEGDHLIRLISICNSLKQGDISVNEIFKTSELRINEETQDLKKMFDKKNT
jgi:hypothetical protein